MIEPFISSFFSFFTFPFPNFFVGGILFYGVISFLRAVL